MAFYDHFLSLLFVYSRPAFKVYHSTLTPYLSSIYMVCIDLCFSFGTMQTRRSRSFSDVDNSPESLLVFSGSNNVHGLFDLLLNYR